MSDYGRARKSLWAICLVPVLALGIGPGVAGAQSPERSDSSNSFSVFERDVFIIVGSTLRNPDAFSDPTEPLFNEAGAALGVTWGDWSAANSTAEAKVKGGPKNSETVVDLDLSGLIPGGVYSIFWGTLNPDSEHPQCPGVERTLPLISTNNKQLPDASSFVAGPSGEASYRGVADGNILTALETFFTVIYHFDGLPHHPFPNAGEELSVANGSECRSTFGNDAMRQSIVLMRT
jgi:hypothetical protein